jgi:hypothetical protein
MTEDLAREADDIVGLALKFFSVGSRVMKTLFAGAALVLWSLVAGAEEEKMDPVMGVYEGFWKTPDGKKGRVTAQIRPIGKGNYDGFVAFYRSGSLEGALKLKSVAGEKLVRFSGANVRTEGALTAPLEGSCAIADNKLTGNFKGELGEGTFEGGLANPVSPTLGAKPPAKGIMMFDGKASDKWEIFKWKITPEGSMVVSGGDIMAKDKFANYKLHLEFKTPFMPEAEGQGRGNSGVYLQNKYEVQVLDSFGLFPLKNNDCAGIYTVKAAEVNACLPPGVWQTYDITYVERGERNLPTVTVVHNGVTVIEKLQIPANVVEKGTGGAVMNGGFLRLQDHGNPVEYRNIWVEPFFATDRK